MDGVLLPAWSLGKLVAFKCNFKMSSNHFKSLQTQPDKTFSCLSNNKEHRFLPCGLGLYDFRVDPQLLVIISVEKGGMSPCAYITSCCKRQEQTVSL